MVRMLPSVLNVATSPTWKNFIFEHQNTSGYYSGNGGYSFFGGYFGLGGMNDSHLVRRPSAIEDSVIGGSEHELKVNILSNSGVKAEPVVAMISPSHHHNESSCSPILIPGNSPLTPSTSPSSSGLCFLGCQHACFIFRVACLTSCTEL